MSKRMLWIWPFATAFTMALTGCGSATPTCVHACSGGEKRCVEASRFQICEQGPDGCRVWADPAECEPDVDCQDGLCVPGCEDTCPAAGETRCAPGGVETCGDHDEDDCLEWGGAEPCGRCQVCVGGTCQADCTDDCDLGERRCEGGGYVECGDFDADEGYEWGPETACGAGEICDGGACVTTGCTDDCPAAGEIQCRDDGFDTCGDFDADDCLEWGDWTECGRCSFCSDGGCLDTCTDECLFGEVECATGTDWHECGDFDPDEAYEWGPLQSCQPGEVCDQGACVAAGCSDECPAVDDTQCRDDGFDTCGDFDDDDCLEWGDWTECGRCSVCADGGCVATCTDECAFGEVECITGTDWRECGDFDADEGYEWGDPVACTDTEFCEDGICQELPAGLGIDIYVDNFCDMTVVPEEVHIPVGHATQLTYYNRSVDYPVDVWLSYIGGFLDLPTGQSWADPFQWCAGSIGYTGYADISTACSSHRLYIYCE